MRKDIGRNALPSNGIKSWPKYERPRELLLDKGAEHLSDAGLIAILLDTGIKGKDAVALARDLIRHFGNLRSLLNANKSELAGIKGLGTAKIARLLAVMEIAKRQFKEEITGKNHVGNRQDIVDYLALSMRDLKEEFFKVVYVNKGGNRGQGGNREGIGVKSLLLTNLLQFF